MKYQQDHLCHVQHLPGHPGACATVRCWLDFEFDSLAWCILKGSFRHPQLTASKKKSPMALCCDILNTWPVQFSRSVVSDSLPPHAHQASLSVTNSRSLLKVMSVESVMPSNHLILCRPLLLLPSIFPSIRVFSSESALRIRWPLLTRDLP